MIIVKNLRVTVSSGVWRCEADAEGGPAPSIWFECVASRNFSPPPDLAAAFVLPAVLAGMRLGKPVRFEFPVSRRQVASLRDALQPFLSHFCTTLELHPVQVRAPMLDCGVLPLPAGGVATGMSRGLDSMAAVKSLLDEQAEGLGQLNTVALFNVGGNSPAGSKTARDLFDLLCEGSAKCAAALGVNFVQIDSNIDQWFPGAFAQLHTLRNASAAYMLSGEARTYVYANGVRIQDTVNRQRDTAYADAIILPLLSTECMEFRQGTPSIDSVGKAQLVLNFKLAQNFLNVCYFSERNCGECEKCLRRMILIDSLGGRNEFSAVLPFAKLDENLDWYIGYVLSHLMRSPNHRELMAHMRASGYLQRADLSYKTFWWRRRFGNIMARLLGKARRPI
jgi:hypothetical protein